MTIDEILNVIILTMFLLIWTIVLTWLLIKMAKTEKENKQLQNKVLKELAEYLESRNKKE